MDTPPEATPPEILDSYPMPLFFGDKYIWPRLSAAAGRNAEGEPVVRAYEQGRVMGGGSSINVQSANRGLPRDYDEWRDLGADGWGWADVLPYFLKLETDLDFNGPLHGKSGPIPIRRVAHEAMPRFGKAVGEALSATGLPFRKDQNAEFEDGIYPPAFSNHNDRRVSSAAGYLDAATRARPNLTISGPKARWRSFSLKGAARRLSWSRGGQKLAVSASRVILTAGALQSPAILMRAGVGPGTALQALGIPVAIDLAGVGSNLRDHPALTFCQYLPRRLRLPLARRRPNFAAMRFSSGHLGAIPPTCT
ncbi:GMC family oxidoreductase N-terminal domain-containing protein (plasmid) [Bradyrhizobium lupini]|uniref:GMC family oxidoreductase N-terminal domain-containing protein n=1 Tax=Rhizobium lupini TaxID=136996 RepID=UPI00366C48FB